MFENRRKYLAEQLKKEHKDMVLITTPSNLYYYTGFTGGEAFFVMTASADDGYVITDSRYYEQVEKECSALTLVRLEKDGYSKTVRQLVEELVKNDLLNKGNFAKKPEVGEDPSYSGKFTVAIEDAMSVSQYKKLCETCDICEFETFSSFIDESRQIKDNDELAKIRQAEGIGDAAFSYILNVLKPGMTEAEVSLELEYFMKKQGAEKLSFDTIVASGENSSMPHAKVTKRKIQKGDFVTMDFGCIYQGYCSDMTRTVAIGNPTEEMKKVYQIVLDANKRAMEQVKEGIACNMIDAYARDYIKECGYGDYFGHGLGHGVGLDIHEEPRFSPKCDVITKENMVITVEPGIYLPGRFGVRIEDLVVVKKDGYENLTHSEKELIVV